VRARGGALSKVNKAVKERNILVLRYMIKHFVCKHFSVLEFSVLELFVLDMVFNLLWVTIIIKVSVGLTCIYPKFRYPESSS
jgi:hypothetical protein